MEIEDSSTNLSVSRSFETTDKTELNPWTLRVLSTTIILKRKLSFRTKSWLYRIYTNTVELCNRQIAKWNLIWKPTLFRTRRGRQLLDLLKVKLRRWLMENSESEIRFVHLPCHPIMIPFEGLPTRRYLWISRSWLSYGYHPKGDKCAS